MKIRVVGHDGAKLSAGAAAIRNVVRFVDALPVLYIVGGIAFFATGERRARLGDLAAKTKSSPTTRRRLPRPPRAMPRPARGRRHPRAGPALTVRAGAASDESSRAQTISVRHDAQRPPTADGPAP